MNLKALVMSAGIGSGVLYACGDDEPKHCSSDKDCGYNQTCTEDCTGPCGEPKDCESICVSNSTGSTERVSRLSYQGMCLQEDYR